MLKFYKLDADHNLVECNIEEMAEWHAAHHEECIVGQERMADRFISTVFIGFAHFGGTFETAIFRRDKLDKTKRYHTWAEALAGHNSYVEAAKRELSN